MRRPQQSPNRSRWIIAEFQGVSTRVPEPSEFEREQRVNDGVEALDRLAKLLCKPGVRLNLSPHDPVYVADKQDPSLVLQTIDGVSRRGRFTVDGEFIEVV